MVRKASGLIVYIYHAEFRRAIDIKKVKVLPTLYGPLPISKSAKTALSFDFDSTPYCCCCVTLLLAQFCHYQTKLRGRFWRYWKSSITYIFVLPLPSLLTETHLKMNLVRKIYIHKICLLIPTSKKSIKKTIVCG